MKLITIDENKLERIVTALGPVVKQLSNQGCELQAAELGDIRRFLRSKIELGPEIKDAKERGRLGGCSRSPLKREKARVNGSKGGPPGTYYGRLFIAESTGIMPAQVIDYFFPNRKRRDEWLEGPGKREALLTVDRDLRIAQMRDPESLADGDARRQQELEREELMFMFERTSDITENCTGCGYLEESRHLNSEGEHRLCSHCLGKMKFLRVA